ncbi:MAG: DUF3618 domain-containing protein [Solirubrobacterales bacterium]
MGQDESQVGARVADDQRSPEEIRREIEETREDLGETAAALAAKTDVKTRAKEKVDNVKQTISDKKESFASSTSGSEPGGPTEQVGNAVTQVRSKAQENPIPSAALAAFVGGFLFGRITKRR